MHKTERISKLIGHYKIYNTAVFLHLYFVFMLTLYYFFTQLFLFFIHYSYGVLVSHMYMLRV